MEQALEQLVSKYERDRNDRDVPAWILPPASCDFLSEIAALFPSAPNAFEFGSGRSTDALRRVSRATTSIEHSREWLDKTEAAMESMVKRPQDFTGVVPLELCWNRLRMIESFDVESRPDLLNRLRSSQLILVDSPPNPAKREHALYLALCHAPVGGLIVIDDLEVRAVTRFARRLALQNAGLVRFWTVNIDHQLALFLKLAPCPVRSLPSFVEFVGTWLRARS